MPRFDKERTGRNPERGQRTGRKSNLRWGSRGGYGRDMEKENSDAGSRSRDREPRRFDRNSGRGDRDSGRRNFGRERRDLEMHKIICSDCGRESTVPFRPIKNKALFCSDCFKKHGGSSKDNTRDDLSEVHKKLDKIMKALNIE